MPHLDEPTDVLTVGDLVREFRKANLCEANLRGANLYGANLYGAVNKQYAIGLPDDLKGGV